MEQDTNSIRASVVGRLALCIAIEGLFAPCIALVLVLPYAVTTADPLLFVGCLCYLRYIHFIVLVIGVEVISFVLALSGRRSTAGKVALVITLLTICLWVLLALQLLWPRPLGIKSEGVSVRPNAKILPTKPASAGLATCDIRSAR